MGDERRSADAIVMCKCGKRPAESEHGCPYQEDVNDNDSFRCTCCNDCRRECLYDI